MGTGGRGVFLVPRRGLTGQQTAQLTGFLSTWGKRRYRRVPATY